MKLSTVAFLTSALALGVRAIPSVYERDVTPADASLEEEDAYEVAEAARAIGFDLSRSSHYGAPTRPGQAGARPGWYFGKHPDRHPKLPCLTGPICKTLSKFPKNLQCPPSGPGSGSGAGTTTTTTVTSTTTRTLTVTSTVTRPGGSGIPTVTVITTTATTTVPVTSTVAPNPSATQGPTYTPTFLGKEGATEGPDYLTFGLVDTIDDCKAMCNSVAGCAFINTYNDINAKDGSPQLTCALFSLCHTDATNVGGQEQLGDGTVNYIINSDGYCKNL